MTEIRERETSLNIKDQALGVSGDGEACTRHSCWSILTSAGTQQRSAGGEPGPMNRKWIIPKFPDTWKIGIGASFFKLLLERRIEAHKGKNQFQLIEQFNTIVERFKTTATGNGKRGKQNKSRRSKKAKAGSTSSTPDGTTTASEPGNDDGSDGSCDKLVTRKRIRLQKSHRILSEGSA